MVHRNLFILLPILASAACTPPPPAPEGLQDSLSYLFRDFYAEDAFISAGLTGFMDWVDQDGDEMLGERADMDNVGTFTLDYLQEADVASLPIEGEVNLEYAPGVVALSQLTCDWAQVEGYLVRADQDLVFGEFDTYERTYLTPRADFEAATAALEFAPVDEPLADAYAAQPDLGDLTSSFLLTDNQVSSTEVGVTMAFQTLLTIRHGVFEAQGEDVAAFLVLTWMPHRAEGPDGKNSIEQSYSLEVNVALPGDETIRMMATWIQIEGIFEHDSDIVKVSAVNKNLDSSQRLVDICNGDEELAPE